MQNIEIKWCQMSSSQHFIPTTFFLLRERIRNFFISVTFYAFKLFFIEPKDLYRLEGEGGGGSYWYPN